MENNDFDDVEYDDKDENIVASIKEYLDDIIRPQLAMAGHDIEFKAYKNSIAYLKIIENHTLPLSQTTFMGIREVLISNILELVDVESV